MKEKHAKLKDKFDKMKKEAENSDFAHHLSIKQSLEEKNEKLAKDLENQKEEYDKKVADLERSLDI